MIDRKEVELLIRAQLKGGRDLASITKSIADLQEAIEKQAQAARRGESAYEGLKAAAAGLKAVQDELGARADTARRFDTLTQKINAQSEAVETARKKLAEYEAKVGSDRTDKQQQNVQRLTKSYENATARLADYQRTFEVLQAALREAGVDTTKLAEEQRNISERMLSTAAAVNRVDAEIRDYNATVTKAKEATARLADEQRKLERLQAGNEADARLGSQQRLERIRREEQAESDRVAALLRLGQIQQSQRATVAADSELAAIRESERFMREYAEAKAKAAATDAGLRKTAEEAAQSARQFKTLERASTDLRPKVVSLREAVDAITNPAAKARSTLAGVEAEIQNLARDIGPSGEAVKDYAKAFKDLQAAQKSVASQATLIDQFRNQIAALRESRSEYVKARAEVLQYAAAVRQGGEAGQAFVKPLAEDQARLRAAAAQFRDQATATREARNALREAGIDSANLASAQQRLVAATQQGTQAMRTLTAAAEANAQGVTKAAKGFSLFRDEGRTTLSFTQRLRGELLALATAYFGIQGAIGVAADSLKAFNEQQGLRSGLAFALGDDPQRVGEEIEYIRKQAERLGVAFAETSKSYVKFAAAGVKSGASIAEVREIFESFAETGRVLNLTPDQINGIFNALAQSFSKGKIQAEELRQQIGERLPGAFAFAQEALKNVFPDLNKALEQGQVGAENLLLIAQSVRQAAQSGLTPALKSLDAEQQRFNNSVLEFKRQIAEAGFADAYIDLLKQLTAFFRSQDGKEFARSLGEVTAAFVRGVSVLVDWRKEIELVAIVIGALVAGRLIANLGASVSALTAALAGARIAAAVLTPVVFTLAGAFTALGAAVAAFFVGFAIGDYLREQSTLVRQFGIVFVGSYLTAFSKIKFGAMELFEDLPRLAENAFKAMINKATELFRVFLGIFQVGARALGLDGVAEGIGKALDTLTLKYNNNISSRVAQIRAEAAADLEQIKRITKEMLDDERNGVQAVASAATTPDKTTGGKPRNGNPPPDENAAKQRATEIARIEAALNALDAKILKKQEDTLESLLQGAAKDYTELAKDIAALGGEAGRRFAQRFATGLTQLQAEITKDFNEKLLKDQESLYSKLEQIESSSGKKRKDELETRLAAITQAQEQFYRDIAALEARLQANGRDTSEVQAVRERADAAVRELQAAERLKFIREQLQARENSINDLLKARELAIKRIEESVVAGDTTRLQADKDIQAVIAQFQPQIESNTTAMREFAEANATAFDPNRLQEFLLKLEQARNSGKALNAEMDRTGQIINTGITNGAVDAVDQLVQGLVAAGDGAGDLGDAFDNAGKAILRMIANILRELAMLILREQVLIQLQAIRRAFSGGGGDFSGAATSAGSGVMHSGGTVGAVRSRMRNVDPSWFIDAPRYHSGGIAGLAPDEYPTILQKNEEVLAASDPRNVLNGGGKPAQARPSSQRFVLVDDRARMAEAMAGAEGEEVTLVHLRKNLPTLRQWLGTK